MQELSLQQVSLSDKLISEIEDILNDYYHRTVAKQGIPPYKFNWQLYFALERMGSLLVTTARYSDRVLVGVCIYTIIEHPHHMGMLVAECDTIATKLEYRGHGIGKRLYLYTEDLLEDRGVQKVIHRFRHVYNQRPMFEDLGFEAIETCYSKELR